MLHATITAYRGYLVFEHWAAEPDAKLGVSLEALDVRAQRVVDTDRNLGISREAMQMLRYVTIKSLGHTANLAWYHEPGFPAELSWRGGRVFFSTPGTLLAGIGSSLHGHMVVANETSPRAMAQIDELLDGATRHREQQQLVAA